MPKYNKTIHILERIVFYCGQIQKTAERFGNTSDAFSTDFAYQSACAMFIVQIGELAARLPEDFRKQYDRVPWQKIRGLRNLFVHEYEGLDIRRIWDVIEKDIPILTAYCEEILLMLKNQVEDC